ncbi:hypothetical protein EHZ13_15095 [Clostridium perfringens]|uniref:hypothetical protein n=1 Tax=Clostridium perfringens TaxID=1502 RepID=UPI000F532ED2|nr:hypothetical protein [Clostridium perfringens]MDK3122636.1 hypothetical protein [Clostridium perfringens]RQN11242.1 hypothetical protein EHZ13_15095 [Clostridium perfringens]
MTVRNNGMTLDDAIARFRIIASIRAAKNNNNESDNMYQVMNWLIELKKIKEENKSILGNYEVGLDNYEKIIEAVKEELRECFEVLKNENITVEYIKFLGKVCTYYGYTIDDLKEKLILNKSDKERLKL